MSAECRHGRYRVEYYHVIDCWDRVECVAWQCIRCGAIMDRAKVGQSVEWPVIGFDPMVRISDGPARMRKPKIYEVPTPEALRDEEDRAHQTNRPHHQLVQEQKVVCGFPAQRTVCECGWRGEWYHQRAGEEKT